MSGKVTIYLRAVCIALAIATIMIFVNNSSMLNEKDNIILNLQNQIDSKNTEIQDLQGQIQSLDVEKNNLQTQVNTLESVYQDYRSTHAYSDSQYWDYINDHMFTNEAVEEISFRFYYIQLAEQKFGVYNLNNDISSLTWVRDYEEHVYDCSEMSADLEQYLENEGWNTLIIVGDSPFSTGRHAWLLVETSEGAYMPVESTNIQVVWWSDPNFDNYFVYDRSFETIQEALEYSETEFDWWN